MPDELALESPSVMITDEHADLAKQCQDEYENALLFRHQRTPDWRQNEELYYNKKVPGLKGRHNVNLPIMSGFVDTLLSKIDNPPRLTFSRKKEGDLALSKKVTAMWQRDSAPDSGNWAWKDILVKKLAIFTGRGIFKYYADSINGKYQSHLVAIDPYDFLYDPMGGGEDEEQARYLGHDNIFKDAHQLTSNPEYNQTNVAKLLEYQSGKTKIESEKKFREKSDRLATLGMSEDFNYQGDKIVKLTEWKTTYQGERMLVLMEMQTGIWIRVRKLREVFTRINPEHGDAYWPYASFAPKPDKFNYWSPAPADDVREINIVSNISVNQLLDNGQKMNFGMRAYDAKMFRDPALLKWRPDGLVPVTSDDGNIRNGIYEFQTPEIKGTIDLIQWLDSFLGRKTGVTADTQGASEEEKVGIFYGNLQQVADRLGLINKSYVNMYVKLGKLYGNGLVDHLTEKVAVRIIGEKGADWNAELDKSELVGTELQVAITGGRAEMEAAQVANQRKADWFKGNANNLMVNPKFMTELSMRIAGFEEEEIRQAMDLQSTGDETIIAEAAHENELLLAGEDIEPNEDATVSHIRKHIDFDAHAKLSDELHEKLIAHVYAEMPIAMANETRRAGSAIAQAGVTPTSAGTFGVRPSVPAEPATVPKPERGQQIFDAAQ